MNQAIPPHRQSTRHQLGKPIVNFSKERYISPQWAAREWDRVWRRSWQAAAHVSDLREPGDHVVYDIGPESVLIARGNDGEVRAFYNVCRHRGVRLVDQRCGQADGFRCPYHSWRYDTDGSLAYVPNREAFQDGLPDDRLALRRVRCDVALGFAWITFDEDVEPLADYLVDMLPLMSHYEFENMTMTLDQTVVVNCNWKAVHDNFSELYHVHYLHPQHRRFVDCTNAISELYPRGHTRVWVPGATTDSLFSQPEQPTDLLTAQLSALGLDPAEYEGRVEDVQAAIRGAKRQLADTELPYFNNFTDEELSDVMQTNVFPNCIFTYQPEMLWLIRPRPHPTDPNRCYLDKISFERFPQAEEKLYLEGTDQPAPGDTLRHQQPGVAGRPVHDEFDYQDVIEGRKSMTDTIDQDLSLLAHAQQGMQSDGFDGLWLNEIECRVSHFHERLDECMTN
jgi:phenylpropionate dioxygenase-like ring-hydroxylating dioxygenase large terminal subunit